MELSSEEFVAAINENRAGSALDSLDIHLISATKEQLVASMPVGPNQRQPFGYLHGGISIALAESVASIGSLLHIDATRQMAFGQEINASHLRAKREGMLTCTATPLRIGRSAHVWDVRITDEEQRLICVCRCTIAVVERVPEHGAPLAEAQR